MITPTTRSCCETITADQTTHATRVLPAPLTVLRPCEWIATVPHRPDGHEGSKRKSRTPPRSSVAGEELQRRARPRPPRKLLRPRSLTPAARPGIHLRPAPDPSVQCHLMVSRAAPPTHSLRRAATPRPGRARRATSSLLGERQTGVSRGEGAWSGRDECVGGGI